MKDPLRFIWPAVEAVNPVFSRAGILRWPKGAHADLVSANLIVPHGTTKNIRCPECGRTHIAEPIARRQPDGSTRVFIRCPENGRAELKRRDLEQWAVNIDALVAALVNAFSLGGKPSSLHADRVWRCGRWNYRNKLRDVIFARGLRRNDAASFRRAFTSAHAPVIFVGTDAPPEDYWEGGEPPVIKLSEVASLSDGAIKLDVEQIIGLIRSADEWREVAKTRGRKKEQAKTKRAVKEAIKSLVPDQELVNAHALHGSYRAAAEALTNEGRPTNRWEVERAVKAAGGLTAVRSQHNSESIRRLRTKDRRDIPRKRED